MDVRAAETVQAIVAFLGDVGRQHGGTSKGNTIPLEWFRWLSADSVRMFYDPVVEAVGEGVGTNRSERYAVIDREYGERLAALDQLRSTHRTLRAGWLFVAGRRPIEGGHGRVFRPMVTVPVRVERVRGFGRTRLVPAGDAELSPLIADRRMRQELEARLEFGGGALGAIHQSAVPKALLARLTRLREFALDAAGAAGYDVTAVVPAGPSAEELLRAEAVVVVAGVGVYAETDTDDASTASLAEWVTNPPQAPTALSALYLAGAEPAPPSSPSAVTAADGVDDGPFVLTPTQTEAVRRARTERVAVLSGAAGTGKSHTIAAIACDAVGRGESVLIAAKSDAAVDALLDLMEHAPGADPVVFGSDERRDRLAGRLTAGQTAPASAGAVDDARQQLHEGVVARDRLMARLLEDLTAEQAWERGYVDPIHVEALPDDELRTLAAEATRAGGWRTRRRADRARAALRQLIGTDDPAAVAEALRAHKVAAAAQALPARGGLEVGDRWAAMVAAVREVRRLAARHLALDTHSAARFNTTTLPAIAALATALRSGRSARRLQLQRLRDDRLTAALPLWIGTLADIEDLLPPVSGLFDLAILDESSSIEQPLAAPALLRAGRAVVVGDPHQLRHVSFLADDDLQAALDRHNLRGDPVLAARLDLRRNSIFDVAVGVAPVIELQEEFRSVPHLVRFLGERVYRGRLVTATTTPANECDDAIDVVRVIGTREHQVVRAEVNAIVRELRNLRRGGHRSVGVVTPFRAQAEAIEAAALAALTADDMEALDLRVGTVHAFQGNERDVVLASIGLDESAAPNSWRFVDDEALFTVMVSRARRRFVVFLSADPPPGRLADYLAQADRPPAPLPQDGTASPWATVLADHLRNIGVPVRLNYPVGRHVLDLCIGDRYRFAAIETQVHPDGAAEHVARHTALCEAGWDVFEAYRSRWDGRAAELAIELAGTLGWVRR